MPLYCKQVASTVGSLRLVASDAGLVAILWPDDSPRRVPLSEMREVDGHSLLLQAEEQLAEYFAKRRTVFTVPLDLRGTTFQRSVWQALLSIRFGETRTYSQIAAELGNAKATRAVGAANGRNPVSIIVPCHRVIGTSGKLTGFAGGLDVKARLLALEANVGGPLFMAVNNIWR
jgi:methylated-DNA-[protein]-cysteine S-methyltransferase